MSTTWETIEERERRVRGTRTTSAMVRAVVIFKSDAQLNRVTPLPARVADSLTIDADPYVEPLEAIMEEQQRVLVLDVAMDKTTFSIFELGYEHELQSISEDLPRATDP